MIERIDNVLQVLATAAGGATAWFWWVRTRRQPYFLLACFYGCFALAGLYWTLYYLLFAQTPQLFYVSETGWVSGYIFLALLQYALAGEAERTHRCPAMWVAVAAGVPFTVFYCLYGFVVLNLVMFVMIAAIARTAVRGICYGRLNGAQANGAFHRVALLFAVLEHALWTSSCFWVSDTLTNPYFWFDFALTGTMLLLLPATRKAVGP